MTISVIIPIFKVEEYLNDCIQSVVNQTYTDWECILVDDGSPDRCPQICDEWENKDSRIKVIHKQNGGLSSARNMGLDIAKGEYIYFLDSDDSILPDTFKGMMELVNKHPGVDMVVAGAMTSEGNTRFSMTKRMDYPDYTEDREWIKCMMLLQNIPMVAWNKLLRRDLLNTNHLRFEEGMLCEDNPWNWLLAKQVKTIAFYKKDTYNYLIRTDSIITNPAFTERRWHDMKRFWQIYMQNIDGYLSEAQLFWIYYDVLGQWLSSNSQSTLGEIKQTFIELSKQSSFRQRLAIQFVLLTPLAILQNVGPVQRFFIDLFGQAECRKYDDRGLRGYFKRIKR